jgi:hypothetical protein
MSVETPIINVKISKPPGEAVSIAQPSPASRLAKPLVWLGAYSSGGLSLPAAKPTASQLYAPRGVWLDDQRLIVCDSGNHRVLIWNQIPTTDGQPADIVLGQPDFESEGPGAGQADSINGFYLPTGVIVAEGKLLIADAWHHRILVWNQVPERSQTPADFAIGQSTLSQIEPNRGMETPTNDSFFWPYGLAYVAGWLMVTDTGNRRVLGWCGIPSRDQGADILLGQPAPSSMNENRGGPVAANSFRWPHAVTGNENQLWVADAGNHRVLGWNSFPTVDTPADIVLGQEKMTGAVEWPYAPQSERRLRFPYCLVQNDDVLAVADTANNRILFWRLPTGTDRFAPASDVIGQADFLSFGENRWTAVTHETLCWPYGIHLHDGKLAVADSGNNRVMIWDCSDICRPLVESNQCV